MAGKIAVESETAKAFTTMADKLFAKLKMAILPVASVEAMAVVEPATTVRPDIRVVPVSA